MNFISRLNTLNFINPTKVVTGMIDKEKDKVIALTVSKTIETMEKIGFELLKKGGKATVAVGFVGVFCYIAYQGHKTSKGGDKSKKTSTNLNDKQIEPAKKPTKKMEIILTLLNGENMAIPKELGFKIDAKQLQELQLKTLKIQEKENADKKIEEDNSNKQMVLFDKE